MSECSEPESETADMAQPNVVTAPAIGNLQEREAELMDFVENAAVPMHWVDEDGTILWANAAEMNLLGYSRDEYIGHSIGDFHADQFAIEDILRRLKSDERLIGYEARLRCKDGSICHVSINSDVYRREGKFIHTRCVTLDITEQKKNAELRERLAAIVESSDDAIVSKDLDGIIRSWNRGAEGLFGYTADEIVGKHISTLAAPERVDEIPDILDRLKRGERVDHYRTKRKCKDGRILTVSLTVSPIRDSTGNIVGAQKSRATSLSASARSTNFAKLMKRSNVPTPTWSSLPIRRRMIFRSRCAWWQPTVNC